MTKIEDFENAPVGATATNDIGHRALKTEDQTLPWTTSQDNYPTNWDMVDEGYTLDLPAPESAREALDLAWELAHEVRPGQVIPKGTRYLEFSNDGMREYTASLDFKISAELAPMTRTVEPLPEPEPDWVDAPAVLAGFDGWSHDEREVFVPTGPHNHWTRVGSSLTSHWRDLRDVTPLYPEGEKA